MMKAGRELDILIAEKVMGCKVTKRHRGNHSYFVTDRMINEPCCSSADRAYEAEDYHMVPNYSTEIRCAWEVVEKIFEMGRTYQIQQSHGGNWQAAIIQNAKSYSGQWYEQKTCAGIADTAPHAICLAALEAIGSHLT